ncbi:MAG: histidine phosphatase family protein [bacterium]|nr:histidine phosphatase family protein [bacterium]
MSLIALVRHGESRWNLSNRFTGWVDVPLTENGIKEAEKCSKQLKKYNFDVAYTSELIRAQTTLTIILARQNRTGIFQHEGNKKYSAWTCGSNTCSTNDLPIYSSNLLNERYYGLLQGMDKDEAIKKYGATKVLAWRRGFDDRPPEGESLKDVVKRVSPYFKNRILKSLKQKENVLVAGHGNLLRAVMMHLNGFTEEDIPFIDLPKGKPVLYEYKRGTFVCRTPNAYTFNRPLR